MTTNETHFAHIKAKPLHATFAAEIQGVDFSGPVADIVFEEILQALTKVSYHILCLFL